MSSRILRWGLLGTANINQAVIKPLRMSPRNQLTAVASRTPRWYKGPMQRFSNRREFLSRLLAAGASAPVLLPAMAKVRPTIMLSVPLIIEKIYKARIQPLLARPRVQLLMKVPPLRALLMRLIGRRLLRAFGGSLRVFAIGGAPLAADVDAELVRRQQGYGRGRRMQIERDSAELLSGVRAGETLGSPIAMLIRNSSEN